MGLLGKLLGGKAPENSALNEKLKDYLGDRVRTLTHGYDEAKERQLASFQALMELEPPEQCELAILAADYLTSKFPKLKDFFNLSAKAQLERLRLQILLVTLLRRRQPFASEQFDKLCEQMLHVTSDYGNNPQAYFPATAARFQTAHGDFTPEQSGALRKLSERWSRGDVDEIKWARKLTELFSADDGPPPFQIERNGEVVVGALLDFIESQGESGRTAWAFLLARAADCSAGKPARKWEKAARERINAVGEASFIRCMCDCLPLVDRPAEGARFVTYYGDQTYAVDRMIFIQPHADALKGLAWMCGLVENDELTRALGLVGVSAYKKVPGIGPRATSLGNACVWALGAIGSTTALSQLALMKVRIKFGTAQKSIEKALGNVAKKVGVTPDELQEMSVPSHGLSDVGRMTEKLGDFTAVLEVKGNKPVLSFLKSDGRTQKSIPAAVKVQFADELKELKGSAKDLEKMLSAQKERLDNLFLLQKNWSASMWRERYLDHPVIGIFARRLIWRFVSETAGMDERAIWRDGGLRTLKGALCDLPDDARVSLWHPIESETTEIVAWRNWLFEHQVQQPFKQAHREIYLLTDAERTTGTYSNRFASHVLKQHQFHSLCAVRGWKNRLRLMVDDEYPPAFKELPAWKLRAEFWVEGVGDDFNEEYVVESGAFRYLTTDQVRFYEIDADKVHAHAGGGGYGAGWGQTAGDPVRIEQIPPLALSEILRDVDLFVGVASVGNDPDWFDGGPEGRHAEYWRNFSFGDLGETAKLRREMLETLLPRLKIAKQCRLEEKCLVVQGTRRAYKIHLGSGNILMEPDDQYLCIVKAPAREKKNDLFLPFEGDNKLAVLLSKAFMLAADDKITDPTIVSQIEHL